MRRSYALGARFERLIEEKVKSGRFGDASEVVRAGLRLLEDQERRRELELEKLRQSIDEGRRSGPPRRRIRSSSSSQFDLSGDAPQRRLISGLPVPQRGRRRGRVFLALGSCSGRGGLAPCCPRNTASAWRALAALDHREHRRLSVNRSPVRGFSETALPIWSPGLTTSDAHSCLEWTPNGLFSRSGLQLMPLYRNETYANWWAADDRAILTGPNRRALAQRECRAGLRASSVGPGVPNPGPSLIIGKEYVNG